MTRLSIDSDFLRLARRVKDLEALFTQYLTGAVLVTGPESVTSGNIPKFADVTGKVLADSGVSLGPWTDYTPNINGLTLGNGTVSGRYARIGQTVAFNIVIAFGSSTVITGDVSFSLPSHVAAASYPSVASGFLWDTGRTIYPAMVRITSAAVQVRAIKTSGEYVAYTTLTPTVPMTWMEGDQIVVAGTYEAA